MSQNVFLAPWDADSFDRTVSEAVDLSEYDDRPEALDAGGEVRLAGVGEGSRNESNFEKLESGDLVLFYEGSEYVGAGWVGTTFEDSNGWVSETLWDDDERPLVFTVDEFTPITVSKAAVNSIFGYSESYNPAGLLRVADDKLSNQPEAIKLAVERYSEQRA